MAEPVATIAVRGVRLGTARAAVKYPDRRDLVLIELAAGSRSAGVFTRNAFCAAPVIIAKKHLNSSRRETRYLLINSGNANAGTGRDGIDDALACCEQIARLGACRTNRVLPFSTGVIGERLPMPRMQSGIAQAFENLSESGWIDAAHGIMTTDTRPKLVSRQITLNQETITIAGIAKGSGMIKPDMATMLAFIATDANIGQALLQQCLEAAVAQSFNAITIDGDTSTNDACMLLATAQTDTVIGEGSAAYASFANAVNAVCIELAQALVRDGEGASKFITIEVTGGNDAAECRQVAYTIAHSPLVKTAFFASDPNWGRILMAVGRSGVDDLQVERIHIYLDDVCIVRNGGRASDYSEERGAAVMAREDITIRVALNRGDAEARIWTTDLSYDYVRINAEYRT